MKNTIKELKAQCKAQNLSATGNKATLLKRLSKEVTLEAKPKVKVKAKKNILDTDYGRQVLAVNTDLKRATKSIGGARAIILNLNDEGLLKLEKYQVDILKASKKNQSVYEMLKGLTFHHPKSGNPSPFYVLQAIYNKGKRARLEALIKATK
jgi:hypothetical protein